MAKTCPGCSKNKPFSEYYQRNRTEYADSAAGYQTICKDCFKEQRSAYVKANPEKCRQIYRSSYLKDPTSKRRSNYKRNFGITLEQYNEMFAAQNGCCKVCERHQSEFKRRLAVDHCHASGAIRGLLCRNCNTALGCVSDSIFVLSNLIDYLTPTLAASSNVVSINTAKKAG